MAAQIHLSAKPELGEEDEQDARDTVAVFHERFPGLTTFHVTVDTSAGAGAVAEVQAWRNKTITPDRFAFVRPNYTGSGQGNDVRSAVESAVESIESAIDTAPEPAAESASLLASPVFWVCVIVVFGLVITPLLIQPRGGRNLVPVNGIVLLGDEPLANAQVTFHPKAGGRPAIATTDEAGKFSLSAGYRGETGAYPGEYRVTVRLFEQAEDVEPEPEPMGENLSNLIAVAEEEREEREAAGLEQIEQPKSRVPARYIALDSTPLLVTVPAGEELKIELTEAGP